MSGGSPGPGCGSSEWERRMRERRAMAADGGAGRTYGHAQGRQAPDGRPGGGARDDWAQGGRTQGGGAQDGWAQDGWAQGGWAQRNPPQGNPPQSGWPQGDRTQDARPQNSQSQNGWPQADPAQGRRAQNRPAPGGRGRDGRARRQGAFRRGMGITLLVPTAVGGAVDVARGAGIGTGLAVGAAVGAMWAAVLAARRGALWWLVPLPVLATALVTGVTEVLAGSGGDVTTLLIRGAVAAFPAMAAGTCAVLLVIAVRAAGGRSRRV